MCTFGGTLNLAAVCHCVTSRAVARTGAVGAGQVLRDGSQGEGAAHAAVPRLERARQLRHAYQEEEDED